MAGIEPGLQQQIRDALELTKNNQRIILNVAFNYGGRAGIWTRCGIIQDRAEAR